HTFLQGVFIKAAERAHAGTEVPGLGVIVGEVRPRFVMLILTALLSGAGILCGIILLVIPGIVLSVWWSLAGIAVVLENKSSASGALGRSHALVRGNSWRFLGLILTLAIIIGIMSSVLTVVARAVAGDNADFAILLSAAVQALLAPIALHS